MVHEVWSPQGFQWVRMKVTTFYDCRILPHISCFVGLRPNLHTWSGVYIMRRNCTVHLTLFVRRILSVRFQCFVWSVFTRFTLCAKWAVYLGRVQVHPPNATVMPCSWEKGSSPAVSLTARLVRQSVYTKRNLGERVHRASVWDLAAD